MVYFKLLRNNNPVVHNFNLVDNTELDKDGTIVEASIYKAAKHYREDQELLPGEIFGIAWFEDKQFLGVRIFQNPVDPNDDAIDMKVETPVNL